MAVIDDILNEFPPVDSNAWEELFLKETKKEKIEIHESILGFNYLPFYAANSGLKAQSATITQLMAKKGKSWNINREFTTENPEQQNKLILESLEKGTSSITLIGKILDIHHLNKLLSGVLANYIEINFKEHGNSLLVAKIYQQWCIENNHDTNLVFGTISNDPITDALLSGKWKISKEEDFILLSETFDFVNSNFKKLKCISINAATYHYAGANLNQALVFSISHALEYLNYLNSKNFSIENIVNRISFHWPTGIHFFGEIAVLRALYLCWHNLINHIQKSKQELFAANITAETSIFYWSNSDKHNNLLRSTTQVMAAIAGGVNSVYVHPYNVLSTHEDVSAKRLATNVQLVLRDESFMDKVIDPTGGSYLVENLTQQFANNAFKEIKEIEKSGGFITQIENGIIQSQIKLTAAKIIEAYKTNQLKILGSNFFPSPNDSDKFKASEFFGQTKKKINLEPLNHFILTSI